MFENAADFNVHAVNHGGMERHFDRLKLLLGLIQTLPGNGMANFPRTDLFAQCFFGKIPTGHNIRIKPAQGAINQPHFSEAPVPLLAQNIPTRAVTILVKRKVLGQRVQRKMRGRESQIQEKRLFRVLGAMAGQHVDGVLGDGSGRVITAIRFDRRQRLIIERVLHGIEVAVVIIE